MKRRPEDNGGFTLVELLIVIAIMGIVIGGMFNLFISTQRHAYTQEEVVDVQQNLRVAIDRIGRDIRNAGLLIPNDPVIAPFPAQLQPGVGEIIFQTAIASGTFARIVPDATSGLSQFSATAGVAFKINVAEEVMVDLFEKDDQVLIIRPGAFSTLSSLSDPTLTVDGTNRVDKEITLIPAENALYQNGDILVRSATQVVQVRYAIVSDPVFGLQLRRNGDVVAGKISLVDFEYLNDRGDAFTPAAAEDIYAIRVTIQGQTVDTASSSYGMGGEKTRTMSTVVQLKNRRI